ncbi:tape measure protein [uncultured Endozoicomonas sp.]|uniref:tape measure protein n=1 Tax=uncultured Endozoicomonas sp. TaxID=432652 RepID=UPI0026099E5A|nr:tape measure protein [uncultured Endozoicomonas sp.]
MSETANLQIRVESKGTKQAERELKGLEKQSARTEQASDKLAGSVKAAGGAIAGYFTVQAAIGVLKTADSFNLLQKRVERLANSAVDGKVKYKALTDIAIKTGSDLKTTIGLWENLDQTLGELGKSDADIIKLTENLNKLGIIGASSSEEMSAAMRQFGQAMAGGVLRAEEFNSIIENTPEVARAMARGMNMSMGEMRAAMLDGELTADKVFEALMSQTEYVNEEFGKMPRTIGQASEALTTNFGNAVAELDKQIGGSSFFVKFLDALSETASDVGEGFKNWDVMTAQASLNRLNIELTKQQDLVNNLKQTVEDGGMGGLFAQGRLDEESQKLDEIKARVADTKKLLKTEQDKVAVDVEISTTSTETSIKKTGGSDTGAQDKEDKEAERAARQLAMQKESASQWLDTIKQRNLDEVALLDEKEQQELAKLDSYREQRLISEQEYSDGMIAIGNNYSAQHAELAEARLENDKSNLQLFIEDAEAQMQTFEGMWGNVFTNFTEGFANATADAIVDGEDFGDAMAGVASGLAKSMIAALIEIGAQKVVLAALEKTLGLTAATGYVTAVTGEATAQTAMAALNAFTSTAAIPIVGPAMAPAAAAAATAAATPMAASAIAAASSTLAGSRSHGGQVMGGSSYLVGEFGPEVLTVPGNGAGSVTPNHKLDQGGKGGVNAITLSPQIVVESGASQSNDEYLAENISAQVFNMILSDLNAGGVLSRSIRGR